MSLRDCKEAQGGAGGAGGRGNRWSVETGGVRATKPIVLRLNNNVCIEPGPCGATDMRSTMHGHQD